ncbi:hypothetical protein [Azospirillum sp. TSO22-1]|uniref:hypothetical protein n=1 Tax=Azospirillum sp. TSO22-1 TaxID=716789 RepID=UPI000D650821|nr:hypothetical protein [Azospirillum sp. TSO22-1]
MTLHHDLTSLSAVLAEAVAQAESGALVDLAGLDARVGSLCAAAAALPRDEGRALLPDLEALTGALNALAGTLARQRELAQGDETHTARQRAAAVYGRPAAPPEEG